MSKQLTFQDYVLERNRQLPFLVDSTLAARLAGCSISTLSKAKQKGKPYQGEYRGIKVIVRYAQTEKRTNLWAVSWE